MSAVATPPAATAAAAGVDPSAAVEKFNFDATFQSKITALSLRDQAFMARVDGLLRPEYFESQAEAQLVNVVLRYYQKYKKVPSDLSVYGMLIRDDVTNKIMTPEQARMAVVQMRSLQTVDLTDREFVVDQVATFARHQAVADAMYKAVHKLDVKDFEAISEIMKKALAVGANMDTNTYDYGEQLAGRTQERHDRAAGLVAPSGISTGYLMLDENLLHKGWGRKELSVLMAPAKGGKSTAMMDFGINAYGAGKNVLYVTLEVSAEIIAMRMDANISERLVNELGIYANDVADKVKAFIDGTRAAAYPGAAVSKAGIFKIEEFPTGSMTVTDLRRLIERYKSKGIIFDLVIIDYADLMAPERFTENVQENSKSIYMHLRGLAMTEGYACLTATQTNREGAKKTTVKATDVADDFNKIRIADIIITINRTDEERLAKQARLFFAACRNQREGFSIRIEQALDRMKFVAKMIGIE